MGLYWRTGIKHYFVFQEHCVLHLVGSIPVLFLSPNPCLPAKMTLPNLSLPKLSAPIFFLLPLTCLSGSSTPTHAKQLPLPCTTLAFPIFFLKKIAPSFFPFQILRNHVMVRVGGGWDTLQHYLYKHDPCRCRQGKKGRYRDFLFPEQEERSFHYQPFLSVAKPRPWNGQCCCCCCCCCCFSCWRYFRIIGSMHDTGKLIKTKV